MNQWIINNAVWLDELGLIIGITLALVMLRLIIYSFRKKSTMRIVVISVLSLVFISVVAATLLIKGPLSPFVSSIAQVQRAMKSDINQFEFITVQGVPMKVEDLNGNKTVLNFWGTYCAPCVRELPALQQLENQFNDKLNVVCLTDEPKEKVNAFMNKRPNHPTMMAIYDKTQWIDLDTFRPLTLLLNEQGKITRFFTHELSFEELIQLVDE